MNKKKIAVILIALLVSAFAVSCTTVDVPVNAADDKSIYIDVSLDIKGLKEDALAKDAQTVNKLAKSSKLMAEEKKELAEAKKNMWAIDDEITAAMEKGVYDVLEKGLEERGYDVKTSMNCRYILHVSLRIRHDRSESLAGLDYSLNLEVEDTKNVPKDQQQNPKLTKYDSKLDMPSTIDTKERWLDPIWGINGMKTAETEAEAADLLLEEIEEQLSGTFFGNLL